MRAAAMIFGMALVLGASRPAGAATTIVQLDTPLGAMTFQLFDDDKPLTTTNFLNYVQSGRFDNSFAHRLSPGFVLQGGAYVINGGSISTIATDAPVPNEAGPFPPTATCRARSRWRRSTATRTPPRRNGSSTSRITAPTSMPKTAASPYSEV